jgi:hypothetical protein
MRTWSVITTQWTLVSSRAPSLETMDVAPARVRSSRVDSITGAWASG